MLASWLFISFWIPCPNTEMPYSLWHDLLRNQEFHLSPQVRLFIKHLCSLNKKCNQDRVLVYFVLVFNKPLFLFKSSTVRMELICHKCMHPLYRCLHLRLLAWLPFIVNGGALRAQFFWLSSEVCFRRD